MNDKLTVDATNEFFQWTDSPLYAWLCECVVILNAVKQLWEAPETVGFKLLPTRLRQIGHTAQRNVATCRHSDVSHQTCLHHCIFWDYHITSFVLRYFLLLLVLLLLDFQSIKTFSFHNWLSLIFAHRLVTISSTTTLRIFNFSSN